jgi:hypothetical protein
LLAALGAPLRPRQRLAELEQVTLGLLRAVGVRVLVIDELHNVLAGRGDTRREFLNLIRFLGNELRIPLVGVGTHEAYLAIRSDDQLENRFGPFPLPRWQPDAEACSLLASFATSCRRRGCRDRLGEEAINQRTLLMADYLGPTERRRLFERELA